MRAGWERWHCPEDKKALRPKEPAPNHTLPKDQKAKAESSKWHDAVRASSKKGIALGSKHLPIVVIFSAGAMS
jgi:hypothetical protein